MQYFIWVWFSFSGRIGRSDYWLKGILPLFAVGIIGSFNLGILLVLLGASDQEIESTVLVVGAVLAWCFLAVYAKRWHDIGKSGWMSLLLLIPFVNIATFIYLGVEESNEGENKYGDSQGPEYANKSPVR